MDHTHSLAHSERLRSRGAIRRLFEQGTSGFVYPLRYMWYADEALDKGASRHTVEVLFTVPKRFHKRANKRNHLRRRVKESYRLQKELLLSATSESPRHITMAVVYSTKEQHSHKTIYNAVRKILESVAKGL